MTAYQGTPVSDGAAAGELYLPDVPAPAGSADAGIAAGTDTGAGARSDTSPGTGAVTVTDADVRDAFAAVAAERRTLAAGLRAAGRAEQAAIVEVGALIAADPALSQPALAALAAEPGAQPPGRYPLAAAVAAVTAAADAQAAILQALPDPDLALRAGDVRQVAAAVRARLAGAGAVAPPPGRPFILLSAEADPADLIRLADDGHLAGVVSVGGGASSHAAVIARGLGLPMLAGADPAVLTAPAGHPALLDAAAGELRVDPPPDDLRRLRAPSNRAAAVTGEARTADGELVTILCNAASAAETRLGLANGAAGVGLLRTEVPFTRARGWPDLAAHLAALTPVLRLLHGKRAVVRLLDFSGDKVPPFAGAAGLTAFLAAPGALAAQLSAVLQAGAGSDLAVMIPMVRTVEEVALVRAELARAAAAAGATPPPLGMMVELAATARSAGVFARHVDFFSIGTNDLTADVLGRERSGLRPADAGAAPVLALIAATAAAARRAGIGLSVCGEAAADPAVLPRLLALGVRTVSVGAARVPEVAGWIAGTVVGHDGEPRHPGGQEPDRATSPAPGRGATRGPAAARVPGAGADQGRRDNGDV